MLDLFSRFSCMAAQIHAVLICSVLPKIKQNFDKIRFEDNCVDLVQHLGHIARITVVIHRLLKLLN